MIVFPAGVYLASNASYLTELGRVHAVKLIGWGHVYPHLRRIRSGCKGDFSEALE